MCLDVILDSNTIAYLYAIDEDYVSYGSFDSTDAGVTSSTATNIKVSQSA